MTGMTVGISQASSDRDGVQAWIAASSGSAFQVHGSSRAAADQGDEQLCRDRLAEAQNLISGVRGG